MFNKLLKENDKQLRKIREEHTRTVQDNARAVLQLQDEVVSLKRAVVDLQCRNGRDHSEDPGASSADDSRASASPSEEQTRVDEPPPSAASQSPKGVEQFASTLTQDFDAAFLSAEAAYEKAKEEQLAALRVLQQSTDNLEATVRQIISQSSQASQASAASQSTAQSQSTSFGL